MESIKKYLVPILKSAVEGKISNSELNLLIKIAHQFAAQRLRQLFLSHKVNLSIYPYNINSIALDCIAEIFRRDEDGNFSDIVNYFSGNLNLNNLTDDEVVIYFRRLIFSSLQDGIFRLYNEYDPILSKIIRNIKIALKKDESIKKFQKFGETFLFSCNEKDRNDHLPEIPLEHLESEILVSLSGKEKLKDYLILLLKSLNESSYRKFISLIDAAVIIKSVIIRLRIPLDELSKFNDGTFKYDICSIVENNLIKIKQQLAEIYLAKNKISVVDFEKYFLAVKEILTNTYVNNDGFSQTYFEYFKNLFPEICYEEYRQKHRFQFEYMIKLSKKNITEELKEYL